MADSGRPRRNYALRGKVEHLYKEYPTPKDLHEALSKGTDDLWGKRISSNKTNQSDPHYRFLKMLNDDEHLRKLDVVFEYVIPGTTRRVDAVVFGEITWTDSKTKEKKTDKYALIAEFKSWDEERWGEGGFESKYQGWSTDPDGSLRAHPKKDVSGFYPLEHPLWQALSYRNFLNNFHSAASNNDWYLDSICFLSGVSDSEFLFSGKACSNSGFCKKVCKRCDDYVAVSSEDDACLNTVLMKRLNAEGDNKHSAVTRSDFACDEFLQGTYMVPLSRNKAGGILRRICLTSGGCYNEKGEEVRVDSRIAIFKDVLEHAFHKIFESGLDGTIDDKRWMIILDVQELLDSKTSADLAMGLQYALLQTGYPFVSLQTNTDALEEMKDHFKETGKPLVEYAFQSPPFGEISRFNTFNAYKWESGVYTTVGIVDLCGDVRDEARNLKPNKDEEQSKKPQGSLEEFLKNSTEARAIFLLVDDKTPFAKELKGDSFAGFNVIRLRAGFQPSVHEFVQ